MTEFPCTGPITVALRTSAGNVHLFAEECSTVDVDVQPGNNSDAARTAAATTRVEFDGTELTIEVAQARGFVIRRTAPLHITVRVPVDSRLNLRSASADMTCAGRFGDTSVNCASADVRIEEIAGALECHTASGDVYAERIAGDATLVLASGDMRLGRIGGDLNARTASGDLTVERIDGSVKASTASGDIKIGTIAQGEARIHTASGDVSVGVAEGTAVYLDLNTASGDTTSELAVSDAPPTGAAANLNLYVRTASGDIKVRRSPAPARAIQD
jgi:DUF4097 and DUF4098 domain-containing protein YvlB